MQNAICNDDKIRYITPGGTNMAANRVTFLELAMKKSREGDYQNKARYLSFVRFLFISCTRAYSTCSAVRYGLNLANWRLQKTGI